MEGQKQPFHLSFPKAPTLHPPPLLDNFSGYIISSPSRAKAPGFWEAPPCPGLSLGTVLFPKGVHPPPLPPPHPQYTHAFPLLGSPGTGPLRPEQLCRRGCVGGGGRERQQVPCSLSGTARAKNRASSSKCLGFPAQNSLRAWGPELCTELNLTTTTPPSRQQGFGWAT